MIPAEQPAPKKEGAAGQDDTHRKHYSSPLFDPVNWAFEGKERVPIGDLRAEVEANDEPAEVVGKLYDESDPTWGIRIETTLIALGDSTRTLSDVARQYGVGRAAVSKVYRDILTRLGLHRIYSRAASRTRMSKSASAAWIERKAKKTGGAA